MLPARKTRGGTRYYSVADLFGLTSEEAPTIALARVSSHDQRADLERQQAALEAYCAAKGWRFEVIGDLGSGLNYRNQGLRRPLELILRRWMRRLVLMPNDRLLRFSADLVCGLCEAQGSEIVIVYRGGQPSSEQELAQDVLEIITVLSGWLCGARSPKTQKLLDVVRENSAEVSRL